MLIKLLYLITYRTLCKNSYEPTQNLQAESGEVKFQLLPKQPNHASKIHIGEAVKYQTSCKYIEMCWKNSNKSWNTTFFKKTKTKPQTQEKTKGIYLPKRILLSITLKNLLENQVRAFWIYVQKKVTPTYF